MKRIILVSASVTLLLAIIAHILLALWVSDLRVAVVRMQDDLQMRNALTKSKDEGTHERHQLEQRQNQQNRLQQETMSLMAALGSLTMPEVCFTSVSRVKNKLIFSGKAQSAIDFTEFLSQWNKTHLFAEIQIDSLRKATGQQETMFHFHALSKAGELAANAI